MPDSKRFLVLLLFGWMMTLSFDSAGAQIPSFRIGVIDNEGGDISNGARLAVEQANRAGGVRGADGTLFQLDLIIQPPTAASDDLSTQIQVLSGIGIVALLGPASDAAVQNNLPALQTLGVPIFTPATDDTLIVADTSGRLFRMRASALTQGRALADYLVSQQGQRSIATLQLDTASTIGMVGFTTAASALGVTPSPGLLFEAGMTADSLAQTLLSANPPVLVVYGNPTLAGEIHNGLRAGGWTGLFVFNDADHPAFRQVVPPAQRLSILSAVPWSAGLATPRSQVFTADYVGFYDSAPTGLAAASYDAVSLIIRAIALPGALSENVAAFQNVEGVQGILRSPDTVSGELSSNVTLVQANSFGGAAVVARYLGGTQIDDESLPALLASPTPTPEGVVATIASQIQNVRSGPGTNFDIIAVLNEGEQVRVIGTNAQNTWLVIDYRGIQGWISASLPDIFGDLNTLPIIQPPPTPTPSAPPTPLPPAPLVVQAEPDLVVESVNVSPNPLQRDRDFDVNVTVRNAGGSNAGQFAVAATFPPDDLFTSAVIGSLAAGQSTSITLRGRLEGTTGRYEVAIVVDLNNQIAEGIGENNNIFSFDYRLDQRVLRDGSQRLRNNDTLGLEGGGDPDDVRWRDSDGGRLEIINGARIRILDSRSLSSVVYSDIDPSRINRESISRSDLSNGTLIGVITAEGRRGVLRVDDVSQAEIDVTFRVYED
jgi:ABC-type branched-subunit amino acid transport system substrate-binding protein